jgi:hypothetical protein
VASANPAVRVDDQGSRNPVTKVVNPVTRASGPRLSRLGLAVQGVALALLGVAYLISLSGARRHDRADRDENLRHQPLFAAIAVGDVPKVWRMLDFGESANAVICAPPGPDLGNCETALVRAVRFGHAPIVKLLIERGANVDARDARGATALDIAKGLARGCGDGGGAATDRCHRYAEVLRVLERTDAPHTMKTQRKRKK